MANYYNKEKYPDPTAYQALKNIEKAEQAKKHKERQKKGKGVKKE